MKTFDDLVWEVLHFQKVREIKTAAFDSKKFFENNFENDKGFCPKMNIAKRYVKNWESVKENNCGLLLLGDVGTGKSYMAACIANALAEKYVTVRMTNCAGILNALQNTQDRKTVFEELDKFDLLILDDLGSERMTAFGEEQVYNIINGRYECGKPLIITTNLSYEEMKNPVTLNAKRIFDRIFEMCTPVEIKGESVRKQISRNKREFMRETLFSDDAPDEIKEERGEGAGNGKEKTKVVKKKVFYGYVPPEREDVSLASKTDEEISENCGENALN